MALSPKERADFDQIVLRLRLEDTDVGTTIQPKRRSFAMLVSVITGTLVFGDRNDPNSKVSQMSKDKRAYRLLEDLGTNPAVSYLKKVDPSYKPKPAESGAHS